ncbi:YiiQ family protein [Rosenbergiella sp. S61]|uniref:YiiQ family protein n=1 Tax=Rosenbergiella gaditana TaxID=2726987 RepID=A0ABS5SZD6_9GAMM|nr:DUF1454 family protein [Rosenbergiella gaditana]MBT0724577.1 YiiQ family protein [Rosenbergiella gaditana]
MRYAASFILILLVSGLTNHVNAHPVSMPLPETAPYLSPDAPTFELTITQFRQQFSQHFPATPLQEFRAIKTGSMQKLVTIAATKISETIYASTALEVGTAKIKSIQLTWLPVPRNQATASRLQAMSYITNIIHFFSPQLTTKQCREHLEQLLTVGRGKVYTLSKEGPVRYILSDKGEGGMTFAAEPVKLVLRETK